MSELSEKPALARRETTPSLSGGWQWWRRDSATLARLAMVVGLLAAGFLYLTWRAVSPTVSGTSSCSSQPTALQPGAVPAPSSVHTVEQAYNCILDIYPAALDDRELLRHALAGMVNSLVQQHQDQHNAVLPTLSGDRLKDWQAFQQVYTAVTAHRSLNEQGLVAATITAMVESLHDDHAGYSPVSASQAAGANSQPGTQVGLGIRLPFDTSQFAHAAPPLYILGVDPGSPAEQAGLRPGDIIVAVNGVSPFLNQQPVPEIISQFYALSPIQLQVRHPGSDEIVSVNLAPATYPALPLVSTRMLPGNILYLRLTQFDTGAADQMSRAVRENGGAQLKGLVLDMRGNGGGETREQQRIISLFVHNQVISTFVDRQGQRTEQRSDDSVPLLHLRLVALIDPGCASACDTTAADIRDLHLGRLVGERTAGEVSGPAGHFFLDDDSDLKLPVSFMQGPAGETVDGIGVPPDDEVQPTLADLATGHDPVLEKALQGL